MKGQSSRSGSGEQSGLVLRLATTGLAIRARHLLGLLLNAKTIGVRVAAFNETGAVFLVRHTYMPGWHLPGGAVDAGETAEEGARRELREEGNIEAAATRLKLHGIHFQPSHLQRDHVLVFSADNVRQSTPRQPDREIAETGFFPLDALPEGTTQSTRRRLDELQHRVDLDPHW